MKFGDVIGQDGVAAQLKGMVEKGRLSHALLFVGREGYGALPMALSFAQYIVCEQVKIGSTAPGEACGQCPACVKAGQHIHPDIHFSYPVIPRKSGDKPISTDYLSEWREFISLHPYGNVYDWLQFIGAENKQGNITASECADILRKLSLKSFESGYKILLMWMPEYLGNEGNKLLKLIEEPPDQTLFILVTEDESKLLPTIVSRTQLVRIPRIEKGAMEKALRDRAGLEAEKAAQLAAVSEGNYREAQQILQHAEEDWMALLRDWMNAVLRSGPLAQVKWVEEIAKQGREKQKQFLRYVNHILEECLRLGVLGERETSLLPQEREFCLKLNKMASPGQVEAIIRELDNAAYYIERNAHAKMLFQALTIKIYYILRDNSVILIH
jgi:DNA polymerase-3 subunit delta'